MRAGIVAGPTDPQQKVINACKELQRLILSILNPDHQVEENKIKEDKEKKQEKEKKQNRRKEYKNKEQIAKKTKRTKKTHT